MIEAKASLGFSPSTAIEDITEEKMQMKFGQKLVEVNFNVTYYLGRSHDVRAL